MVNVNVPRFKSSALMLMAVTFLFLMSCVKDNFDFDKFSDQISYRPSFVIPAAHGSLTLGNLLEADDSLVFFDPDNSIRIFIREDSVFSISVGDILEIPLPDPISQQFDLFPIAIDDFSSSAGLTLNELTGRISDPESSQIHGAFLTNSIFPPVPQQYAGTIAAGPLQNIDWAHFTGGEVGITLTNNFPVTVNLELRLLNAHNGAHVGYFLFENLAPQQVATVYSDLSGTWVDRELVVELFSFNTPGSGETQVYISPDDNLAMEIVSRNLFADIGRAAIPKTQIGVRSNIVDLSFDADQVIDELNLDKATFSYNMPDIIGGSVRVDLVNLSSEGQPCGFDIDADGLGGMLEGSETVYNADFSFSEYDGELRIDYTLFIGSDDSMVDFDLSGGILNLDLRFDDFELGYASGYFGHEEYDIDDEELEMDFDLFDRITGDFRITNPSIRLFYNNSVGVPVNMVFNLSGSSSDGSKQVDLFGHGHDGASGFSINYPQVLYDEVPGEILIDRETSNIVDFIALPPANINLNGSIVINPDGQTDVPNFITSQGGMHMGMEFELPLEMQLTNLGLTDTIEVDFDPEDIDIVEKLVMMLDVTNGFPIGVSFDLLLYDSEADLVLHSYENIVLMEAAPVDAEGRSIGGQEVASSAEIEVTGETVDHLKQSTHFIISARFNTGKHQDSQLPVRFQTTDNLSFRIRLRAELNIQ